MSVYFHAFDTYIPIL